MLKLTVDPAKKKISISANLVGEDSPITVDIGKYTLGYKDKQHYLRIDKLSISKEWMDILAKKFIASSNDIPVPAELGDFIKIIK